MIAYSFGRFLFLGSLFINIVRSYIVKNGAAIVEFKKDAVLKKNPKRPQARETTMKLVGF